MCSDESGKYGVRRRGDGAVERNSMGSVIMTQKLVKPKSIRV